jgi:succinoglycan biosynthesis protein ExoV
MSAAELLVLRYDDGVGNFGDDLNDLLWPRLLPSSGVRSLNNRSSEPVDPDALILVGVGTILNERVPAGPRKLVLGAGTGYLQSAVIDDTYDVLAVRGPLTAERLGLDASLAATDAAALLVDLDLDLDDAPRTRVGVMPHHRTMDGIPWADVCAAAGVTLLDPRDDPVTTIARLRACDLVLAEAMHGAIVADLYGVPWVPIKLSYLILDFKWNDWCASLGLDYRPEVGPVLRSPRSWKGRAANLAARRPVVRFLKEAQRATPVLSDRNLLSQRIDRLRAGLDRVRVSLEGAS